MEELTGTAFTEGLGRIAHLLVEDPSLNRRELSTSGETEHTEVPHQLSKEELRHIEKKEIESAQMAICFLFIALLTGQFLHHLSHKIHFPYTPLVTIVGMAYGVIDTVRNGTLKEEEVEHAGVYKMTMYSFQNPAPELVFLIFLPALIFESAVNSDWYIFKR